MGAITSGPGEDLSLTPEYGEFQALVDEATSPQREEADNPKIERKRWETVLAGAESMLQRSQDLWLAVLAAGAKAYVGGLRGFADGVKRVEAMALNDWEALFPKPEPDEQLPSLRINALAELGSNYMLRLLRDQPLFQPDGRPPVAMRDVLLASEVLKVSEDQPRPDVAALREAFAQFHRESPDAANELLQAIDETLASIEAIVNFVRERHGATVLRLDELCRYLNSVRKVLVNSPVADVGAASGLKSATTPSVNGDIASRAQAIEAINRVIHFLKSTEPSSPAPLLLEQAQRMIGKGFLECLAEMGRLGFKEVKVLATVENSEQPG